MIHDPNFSLELGQPWRRIGDDVPGQYSFSDDDRQTLIILSSVTHKGGQPRDLDYIADILVEQKLRAEVDAARILGQSARFYEPIISPQPWGRAVAYYGRDEAGRQFSYSGTITRDFTINLYMLSKTLSEREMFETMDDVFSKIEFDRTPLHGALPFD